MRQATQTQTAPSPTAHGNDRSHPANGEHHCRRHMMASLPIDVNRSGFESVTSDNMNDLLDNSIVTSSRRQSSSLSRFPSTGEATADTAPADSVAENSTASTVANTSTGAAAFEDAGSITRRADLKQAMYRRRMSLTVPEQIFLHHLVDQGTEKQVRNAVRRLDSDLFEDWEGVLGGDEAQGKNASTASPSEAEEKKDRSESVGSCGSSTLRLARLADRRKQNALHSQLWEAHASGVFRPVHSRSHSVAVMPAPRPFASSSNLRRSSTGRRKSVTFHRSVSSAAAITPISRDGFRRSNSVSSIPSIRPATAIRSDSMASNASSINNSGLLPSMSNVRSSSISSIPSIRPATAVRSDSISSIPSFVGSNPASAHYSAAADRIAQMWAQMGEEKTMSDRNGFDSHNALFDESLTSISIAPSASTTTLDIPSSTFENKPVLVRLASRNKDDGQGVEVLDATPVARGSSVWRRQFSRSSSSRLPTIAGLRRSLSDDEISYDPTATLLLQESRLPVSIDAEDEFDDEASWDMMSDGEHHFDAWDMMREDTNSDYATNLDFQILGTSAQDVAAIPHVLSPPLMESLSAFLPEKKAGQNFLMKYSLVRDGAHINTFLKHARGAEYSILAMETVDGEVFGAFTSQAWRKNWNYFGAENGRESFLWRMRRSRLEKCKSILDQANLESEIDVFPYTGANELVQLCTNERVAVGGGTTNLVTVTKLGSSMGPAPNADDWRAEKSEDSRPLSPSTTASSIQPHEWGFGLCLDSDLLTGTSSPCLTFDNPSLSRVHSDGSRFEIVNLELWTLTPCATTEDALQLELGKLFFSPSSSPENSPVQSPRRTNE